MDIKNDPARFTILLAAHENRTRLVGCGRTVDAACFYFVEGFVAFTLSDGSVERLVKDRRPPRVIVDEIAEITPEQVEGLRARLPTGSNRWAIFDPQATPEQFVPPLPEPGFTYVDDFCDWEGYFTADQMDAHAQAAVSLVLDAFAKLLPTDCRYMDPPDGGDVSVLEQVRRMAEEAKRWAKCEDLQHLHYREIAELDTLINGVPTGSLLPALITQLRAQQPVQILNLADGMRINFQAPDGRRGTINLRTLLGGWERTPGCTAEHRKLHATMRAAMAAYPVAGVWVKGDNLRPTEPLPEKAVCPECNGTRCLPQYLGDPPTECQACTDQEP